MGGSDLSVLIPAYNEASGIRAVIEDVLHHQPDAEVIVCDDGSTDGTVAALDGLPIRIVRHRVNRGYGAAWKTLAKHATRRTIVYFDGDGQFDPADIGRLIEHRTRTGADMVSGRREGGAGRPLRRRPGKWFMRRFAIWLTGEQIPDVNCGLRLVDRAAFLPFLPLLPDGFSCSTTSLLSYLASGRDVHFVPIDVRRRTGTSSVRIVRDGLRSLLLIIRMTTLFSPLRVFLPVSATLLLAGLGYSIDEAIRSGLGVPVLGAILLVNGVIVFLFGILADQVAAIRIERLQLGDAEAGRATDRRPLSTQDD
jgi:glycosyltransferase involved in cell wall biosynthesis